MLPRARDDHARPAHERQGHAMGDTCIPPTPNQLLTAILSSTMQSSCLFRLSSVDCAACVHRSTAAAWPGPQVDSRISENLEGMAGHILTIRRHSLQQDDTSAKIFNHRLLDARCHQLLEAHGSRVPRLAPWQCKKQQIGASRKECHLRCKRTAYLVSVTLDDSVKSTDDPFSPRM